MNYDEIEVGEYYSWDKAHAMSLCDVEVERDGWFLDLKTWCGVEGLIVLEKKECVLRSISAIYYGIKILSTPFNVVGWMLTFTNKKFPSVLPFSKIEFEEMYYNEL